jgi:hypothetical protein
MSLIADDQVFPDRIFVGRQVQWLARGLRRRVRAFGGLVKTDRSVGPIDDGRLAVVPSGSTATSTTILGITRPLERSSIARSAGTKSIARSNLAAQRRSGLR